MRACSFHINKMRHLLLSSRGICRGKCREWSSVKKTALSDRREFVVFRNVMNETSEPDSYRARSRHDRFFYDTEFSSVLYGTLVLCVSIFSGVKRENAVNKIL